MDEKPYQLLDDKRDHCLFDPVITRKPIMNTGETAPAASLHSLNLLTGNIMSVSMNISLHLTGHALSFLA